MTTSIRILEEMNAYNTRVNLDLIDHIIGENPTEERIAVLMSHIINAHQIWLSRMLDQSVDIKVFEIRSYDELKKQLLINQSLTIEIIQNKELGNSIQYVNTKGQKFSNTLCEMFLHVFNHSSYHRGQINQLLVKEGKQAMVTDFITYYRNEIL